MTSEEARREAALRDVFTQTKKLARRMLARLEKELDRLEAGDGSEAATKELLALVKALQSMEELAATMQKAIDERDREPQDILEFRRKLEGMLEALAAGDVE